MDPEMFTLEDWSVCFQSRYGNPHEKHWYAFDLSLVPNTVKGDGYLCEGLAKRQPRFPAAPVPVEKWGVHESHCCKRHGCQYESYEKCPVVAGAVDQEHPCDRCSDPMEMSEDLVEELAGVDASKLSLAFFAGIITRAVEIKRLREVHDG